MPGRDALYDLAAAILWVGIALADRAVRALPARGRRLGEAREMTARGKSLRKAFPAEEAERIRKRLVGVRFELEEALTEGRDAIDDPDLDDYLCGALLNSEGAVQRLDQLRETAACPTP